MRGSRDLHLRSRGERGRGWRGSAGRVFRVVGPFAIATLVAGMSPDPAPAEEIGTFRHWRAHHFAEKDGRVCTMWTQPRKAEGNYTRRGEIFVLVNHRPAEKRTGIVSFELGYPFAPDEQLTISIDGGEPVRLPAHDSLAWDDAPEVNQRLVRAMRAGREMVVTGRSRRGTKTTDTYSLLGFTAAYKAISRACKVSG